MIMRSMLQAGLALAAFGLVGALLLGIGHAATADRILANERAVLLRDLAAILPADQYDNVLDQDVVMRTDAAALGSEQALPVYRARRGGTPVAAVMTVVAPDGYSGDIRLLVGVRHDGSVAGVRILSHRETPGLGDAIEPRRSDWLAGFVGLTLGKPPEAQWAVRRDGGVFDQFTGATITPRAVAGAIRRALKYFAAHRDELFKPALAEDAGPERGADRS